MHVTNYLVRTKCWVSYSFIGFLVSAYDTYNNNRSEVVMSRHKGWGSRETLAVSLLPHPLRTYPFILPQNELLLFPRSMVAVWQVCPAILV